MQRKDFLQFQEPLPTPARITALFISNMEHSDKFLQWLKDSDAYISPKIAIKDYSEEGARLGVVALEDIKVRYKVR